MMPRLHSFSTCGTLVLLTFFSVIFFPWQLTMVLALLSTFFVPLLPLAIGIFADTLYYSPHASFAPLLALSGAFLSGIAIIVHQRLRTGII